MPFEPVDHSASAVLELLDEPEEELLEDELLDDELLALLDAELLDVALLVASFSFALLAPLDPLPAPLLDEPLFVLLPFSVLPQTVRLVDHERSTFQS